MKQWVFIGSEDAARSSSDSGEKQWKEHALKREHRHPEMYLAQSLVHHAPEHLRVPIIESRKASEERDREERVVEVRHHKVGSVQVDVGCGRTEENTGHTAEQKAREAAECEQHRRVEPDGP